MVSQRVGLGCLVCLFSASNEDALQRCLADFSGNLINPYTDEEQAINAVVSLKRFTFQLGCGGGAFRFPTMSVAKCLPGFGARARVLLLMDSSDLQFVTIDARTGALRKGIGSEAPAGFLGPGNLVGMDGTCTTGYADNDICHPLHFLHHERQSGLADGNEVNDEEVKKFHSKAMPVSGNLFNRS